MLLFTSIYQDKEAIVISVFIYAQETDIAPKFTKFGYIFSQLPLKVQCDLNKFHLFGVKIGD